VNFCPSCKTVLANEQVVDGKCERCASRVVKKYLEQWFFKITDYAEHLLSELDGLDWPVQIKTMQKNWIGKSEGVEIVFECRPDADIKLNIFTTRADTLFGCTYVVLAPESELIAKLKPWIKNWSDVNTYINASREKGEIERTAEEKEKTGIELKGVSAVNPVNNREIPLYVADYVLPEYGTGVVMAVPAHDQRDFLFAKNMAFPL